MRAQSRWWHGNDARASLAATASARTLVYSHQGECVALRVLGKCAQKVRFHTAPNAVPNDVSFSIVSAGSVIGSVKSEKSWKPPRGGEEG